MGRRWAAEDQDLVTAAQALMRLVDAAGSAAGKYQRVVHSLPTVIELMSVELRPSGLLTAESPGRCVV